MTDAKMALLELVEQEADIDLVREMLAFAAERMMDLEIEAKTGVPAGTRSPDRLNHRNAEAEGDAGRLSSHDNTAVAAIASESSSRNVASAASEAVASFADRLDRLDRLDRHDAASSIQSGIS